MSYPCVVPSFICFEGIQALNPIDFIEPAATMRCYDRQHVMSGKEGAMPRRPAPVGETKSEKFQRLATLRANQILEDLRKLGNLSNKNHYEYTEDEVQRIFATIEKAVADAKGRFLGRTRRDFRL
jgi:hypothetical protein